MSGRVRQGPEVARHGLLTLLAAEQNTSCVSNSGSDSATDGDMDVAYGLLLIAAVPPLAIGYPANKLRDTAVIMNMCIFGAVAQAVLNVIDHGMTLQVDELVQGSAAAHQGEQFGLVGAQALA